MHKRFGFTIVEVMVVAAVLATLLIVGIVGVRSIQMTSRDNERQNDIDTLAINFETIYAKEIRDSSNTIIKPQGSYMPVAGGYTASFSIPAELISELEKNTTLAPGQTATSLQTITPTSCNSSTSNATVCYLSTGFTTATSASTVTKNRYVYVPLVRFDDSTKRLCTVALIQSGTVSGCHAYELYYVKEKSTTTVLKKESKGR